jgi:ATP phosphoribosyltransferase regulatory subunit
LDLQTFKLVDQISGRSLGLRADMTQQVARIDAHLLNRQGVTRLCYCGPVLHAAPDRPRATREPLQFGAEIYGHAGPEADMEALSLALACVQGSGVQGLLAGVMVDASVLQRVHAALASKDATGLAEVTQHFPQASREGLLALQQLYGDVHVLDEAEKALRRTPGAQHVLQHLKWFAAQFPGHSITFDLADLRGYSYYSGTRFAVYAPGASDALVRGGRYDEVGAVFGRNRPAAGFSLDIKQLVSVVPSRPLRAAIRAPWGNDAQLSLAIAHLRSQGETVVCVLPGHESEVDEFHCDRVLVHSAGQWVVQAV